MMIRHLDLFAGIGGFALSGKWVWGDEYINVGHSEIDKYCCQVYHKHFPESKCFGDITKVDWSKVKAELVTGGFPCQPFSVAGKRRGKADDRYLWPPMFDAIRTIHPRFVLVENVPGVDDKTYLALDGCISDLESEGYEVASPFWIPACAVGAPHRRERVWIVGYSKRGRCNRVNRRKARPKSENRCKTLAYANSNNRYWGCSSLQMGRSESASDVTSDCSAFGTQWSIEPNVGRVAYGVPHRVDRLRALGNAIVPQVAVVIMQAMKEAT